MTLCPALQRQHLSAGEQSILSIKFTPRWGFNGTGLLLGVSALMAQNAMMLRDHGDLISVAVIECRR
jgi:hypothetical protein